MAQNIIDKEVVRILTVYSPVATDLRYVLTVSHVTSSLERIGDQATNVIGLLQLMMARSTTKPEPRIIQMGQAVTEMLHGSIGAYINRDIKEAEKYRNRDEYVDSLNDQIMREVLNNFAVNKKKMIQLAETGYTTATDLADYIVRKYKYPFRKAYLITSKIVNIAEQKGKQLNQLTEKEIKGKHVSPIELQYAKICSAYLYLYKMAEEKGVLEANDPDNPFEQETLH